MNALIAAVEALIESGPHVMFLDLKTKSYKHSHTECQATLNRLIKALAEARSEEAK